jgi:hypothetical protein
MAIFQPSDNDFRVLAGETKTAFYDKRFLAPGVTVDDVEPGEFLGLRPQAGSRLVADTISSASEAEANAASAIMRVDTTKYDSVESGAVTCLDGLYILETEVYVPGASFSQDDFVTLEYDAGFGGGVLGPLRADGAPDYAIGQVQSPPADSTNADTPMRVKMFANAMPVATDGSGNPTG